MKKLSSTGTISSKAGLGVLSYEGFLTRFLGGAQALAIDPGAVPGANVSNNVKISVLFSYMVCNKVFRKAIVKVYFLSETE